MLDRILGRRSVVTKELALGTTVRTPHTSFGAWENLGRGSVVQVCHPDWRGVRTVAYSFRTPVVECDDLELWGEELASDLVARSPDCVVIQGWPPGSTSFANQLTALGVKVKCVLHSSAAQHGGDAAEGSVADEILALLREGGLHGLGMAKDGLPEAFTSIGYPVSYVPNRAPVIPQSVSRSELGGPFNVGVFADPYWRKNVTTQLLAVGLMEGATAHVMLKPGNMYLREMDIVEHGILDYDTFISLQASVDLNLYVTLSECHPSTPQESYMTGVPCLFSRTSAVFRSDQELWKMTTVEQHDNPAAIATAGLALYDNRDEATERALKWIDEADRVGKQLWAEFVKS